MERVQELSQILWAMVMAAFTGALVGAEEGAMFCGGWVNVGVSFVVGGSL